MPNIKKTDIDRALKLYTKTGKYAAKGPCAVEVKNRGESYWRRYKYSDINHIDFNKVDACRLHFADKAWKNDVPDETYTTVIRVYPK